MIPPNSLLFLLYFHTLTIATLSWLVCLSPWSANFKVPVCAACLVVCAPPYVHITPILKHLHSLPIRAPISCKIACLCFNTIASSTPAYLSDLLYLYLPSWSLHASADTCLLKILLYEYEMKGDCAFLLWSFCPELTTTAHENATTINTFKSAPKTYFFSPQEPD